ncbi:hypothetical protein C8Q78DRAFT_965333 [Trametes maxima]|nr:hypothetical protein C8Q78DRAFT_965333 [Trametes maxima]
MFKNHGQKKQKSKTSDAARKGAADKQIQAARKRSKAHSRISRSKAEDVTAQINGEFMQVQNIYVRAGPQPQPQDSSSSLPESTVQDLADVMKSL